MDNIKHVGIYVNDLKSMRHFYEMGLNMKVIQSDCYDSAFFYDQLVGKPNAKVKIVKLITDRGAETRVGDMIELIEVVGSVTITPQGKRISSVGTMHVAFGVSDIHRSINSIRDFGGEVIVAPFQRENGNWLAFAKDVEGNWLEIIQNV